VHRWSVVNVGRIHATFIDVSEFQRYGCRATVLDRLCVVDQLQQLRSALAERYRVHRELGRGGMATVYLAEDLRHHRQVAIKVLRPELASVLGPQRFLREIEVAAGLTHPHILPLFDSGEARGLLYYVMPYIGGESLRERLNRERQLAVAEAVEIAREVADALACAHANGVVHRDIKPENILLEAGHAVVTDFGIARALGVARGGRLTQAGSAMGTPEYMSPEQASGAEDLDGRSDVYGLGCVLYEMLSGETPYTGPTPQSILAKKLNEPLPRITVVRPTVPKVVEAALQKALARTPADRYASAAHLSAALRRAAAVEITHGSRGRGGYRRQTLVLLLVAVGAIAASAVVNRLLLFRTTNSRQVAVPLRAVLYENPSVAILPPRNLGAEEDGPFVEGLHDDILSALQKIGGLTVISRTSVRRYRDRELAIPEIARALRVDAVGEATVSRSGDRIRVNIQLIDGATDAHLWSEQYDRELTPANLFAIRSDIARAVAGAMRAVLTTTEEARLAETHPTTLSAYDWQQIALTRCDGCEERAEAYRRALETDPDYAAAWAGLASNYAVRVLNFGASPIMADSALRFADRALDLNPVLPGAYSAKGLAYYAGWGQTARALQYLRKAAQLEPGNASRWTNVGAFSAMRGDWVGSLDAYWRSLRLSPTSAMVRGNMAELYSALDLPERAMRVLEEASAIDPTDVTVLHYSSYAHALTGDFVRARELAEENVTLHPQARLHQWAALLAAHQSDLRAARSHAEAARELASEGLSLESNVHSVPVTLAYVLIRSGDPEQARQLLDVAFDELRLRMEQGADDGYTRVELAAIEASRGHADDAVDWLQSAFNAGYRYYREIEVDPLFDSVRNVPRFQEIMSRFRTSVTALRQRVEEQEADLERARMSVRRAG